MYRADTLDMAQVLRFIADHETGNARRQRLLDYYRGAHTAILEKTKSSTWVPNHHIMNPYPAYITDMQVGYFLGKPVAYTYDDTRLEEALGTIFAYNDEQAHNLELARTASILGEAYEVLYYDKAEHIRMAALSPLETFVVYDKSLENNILYAVRYYDDHDERGETRRVVAIYTPQSVLTCERTGDGLVITDEVAHGFKDVPVNRVQNNIDAMGDFEKVLPLIDAYDAAASNTLDDMDMFTDAYLVLTNLSGTEEEDLREMRQSRTILLTDDGRADWLVKQVNDTWVENYKNRLDADIHKFSFTPNMADVSFGANQSGVAIRYKILGMEQLRAIKERGFKKALQRRIELICNHLGLLSTERYDYLTVHMTFNNILPQNLLEQTQVVNGLKGLLSEETLLTLLPFVEDPKTELERRETEQASQLESDYDRYSGGLNE